MSYFQSMYIKSSLNFVARINVESILQLFKETYSTPTIEIISIFKFFNLSRQRYLVHRIKRIVSNVKLK